MDQLILFHKPNKKVRSENKMDHFISQTKHTIIVSTTILHATISNLNIHSCCATPNLLAYSSHNFIMQISDAVKAETPGT
jgi:hypothetical protein